MTPPVIKSPRGSIVALVTPMLPDGQLDWSSLDNLVDWHVASGTHAIVAVGTTGESATLSMEEHEAVIRRVVSRANGRIPVVAGTGANSTSEAIHLTRQAHAAGADACLLVTPYYNKPPQEGLYQHFRRIAETVPIDQILYNVPGRTACDLSNETALRLAEIPNIIGIKDATGDLERGQALIAAAPTGFSIYSGDDPTAIDLMLMGATGNISVTANVLPEIMSRACELALQGEAAAARSAQQSMMPLHQSLFTQANPIPVKWALHQLGRISPGIRLPLVPLAEALRPALQEVLLASGAEFAAAAS